MRTIFQSTNRPGHSTETAILKVVNDLLLSLNKCNMSVLALLDSSSVYDKIDHPNSAHRLHTDFGLTNTAIQWFSSYLTDRSQYASLSNHCSAFLLYTQVFPRVQFLALCFSSYILSYCLPLSTHTPSYTIHLLMTYNYGCMLALTKYLS